MYPKVLFLGLNLYDILIFVGLISALVAFRILTDYRKMGIKNQRIFLLFALPSICFGFLSAAVIQGLYEVLAGNSFTLTKITFFGGLIGGAVTYLLLSILTEKLLLEGEARAVFHSDFMTIVEVAPACIAIAHAFGRLGCLMGGCCYGAQTDAWYGVSTPFEAGKVVPIPLFEALFLFALFAAVVLLFIKGKWGAMSLYLVGYGIWRFVIEFFRTDARGETFISVFTPSQLTAIIAIFIGIFLYFYKKKKRICISG